MCNAGEDAFNDVHALFKHQMQMVLLRDAFSGRRRGVKLILFQNHHLTEVF